jgi:hypothetical protein
MKNNDVGTMQHILGCLMFLDLFIIVKFIKKNPTRCNNVSDFIIPYLYEAQHVSSDTPPVIRSLKLHWQPLVGRVVGGRCRAHYVPDNVHQIHVQQLSTYEKPEAASAVLGS